MKQYYLLNKSDNSRIDLHSTTQKRISNEILDLIDCKLCCENIAAAISLQLCGETHSRAKLTEKQVREMRAMYAYAHKVVMTRDIRRKYTIEALAAQFGVHYQTAHSIINRKTWKHVD